MGLIWDEAKREATLQYRGLDFADAAEVIDGPSFSFPDHRQDYGEERTITVGFLEGRMTVVVWTPRGRDRRIISMRKANEREIRQYGQRLARPR
ncbi:MAG: BrnT family toxin [Methylotetracoccus sp.]|nr:BrnT family toxin [Methylotetracoccus sp.]